MTKARQFWYVFDSRYIGSSNNPEVIQLYLDCNLYMPTPNPNRPRPHLDWMFNLLKDKMRVDPLNYEQLFLIEISRYKEGIEKLARDQTGIIFKYLVNSKEIQQALELFGQGVLFNETRGNVHKMQGTFPQHLVGYKRWHGFTRAAVLIGEDYNFWLNLDRSLLLAYILQVELKPLDTKRDNPFMSEERLTEYQSSCMSLDFKSLDEAFNYHFP